MYVALRGFCGWLFGNGGITNEYDVFTKTFCNRLGTMINKSYTTQPSYQFSSAITKPLNTHYIQWTINHF